MLDAGIYKPSRKSWSYQIYCDLCISLKLRNGGVLKETNKGMIWRIAQERDCPPIIVKKIWRRAVRPRLNVGIPIEDLK